MPKFMKVSGAEAVKRALKALPAKVERKVLRQSLRAACKDIAEAARSECPVDSGQLRDAIKVRALKAGRGKVGVQVRIGEGDFAGDTFYGAMVEYGTSKMEADPFMERAYGSAGRAAAGKAMTLIRDGIEREAKASK